MITSQKFMTNEERKHPLIHHTNYCIFESTMDLSGGVTVSSFFKDKKITKEIIAKDITCFIGWWLQNIRPRLNGFPGLDTIKYEFKEG